MSKSGFTRTPALGWSRAIAGARWYRCDFHLHTIDDLEGGGISLPADVGSDPSDPKVVRAYARRFLAGAIAARIQVLGITPHCVRVHDDLSAVWTIVDVWNTEADDAGLPFRDSIFAVFPGIEPSFNTGSKGLHLQFLFDPEIGRLRFLKAADLLWKSISPWSGMQLRVSGRDANAALQELKEFHTREGGDEWSFLVLAPHVERETGLFGAKKGELQSLLNHSGIAAFELNDSWLPERMLREKGEWFSDGLERYRHALYHSSDAYKILPGDPGKRIPIGYRYTWLKLAQPRIESLRQAFIASESRLRIAYRRDEADHFVEKGDPPDASVSQRSWIKSVTVRGGASFFGGKDASGKPRETQFRFNPDLTCIIGGSMTGKSTLLDGLRVRMEAGMPSDRHIQDQVVARARTKFLAGDATVDVEISGSGAAAAPVFFSQNELQRYSEDRDGLEALLVQLVPDIAASHTSRKVEAAELEKQIATGIAWLDEQESRIATADQEFKGADDAQRALTDLAAAGFKEWQAASAKEAQWRIALQDGTALLARAEQLREALQNAASPPGRFPGGAPLLDELRTRAASAAEEAQRVLAEYKAEIEKGLEASQLETRGHRASLERVMVDRGLDGGELDRLRQLTDRAKHRDSYSEARKRLVEQWTNGEARFRERINQRRQVFSAIRANMTKLADLVERDFGGAIRIEIVPDARNSALEAFLGGLGQKGLTRWCNDRKAEAAGLPSPYALAEALQGDFLDKFGMSETVQDRFREALSTASKRRQFDALGSSDIYNISYRLPDGSYKGLRELSGGRRVGVILTLLLESSDTSPLIIDQPEDELDNEFLSHVLLPALRRLKGRRQIIVATHNANLVVNGDADLVIQLEATASQGSVAQSGAIEEAGVRTAILETVDGGQEAFRLRRMKYGF